MFLKIKSTSIKRGFILPFLLFISVVLLSACATNKTIPLYEKTTQNRHNIATLSLPIEIDLVYIDGKPWSFLPRYQPLINYGLLPGEHSLAFRYEDMPINDDGNEETIKSPVVIIRFEAKAGEKYHIDFNKPVSFEAALKLETELKLTLSDKTGVIASSRPTNGFSLSPNSAGTDKWFGDDESMEKTGEKPAENADTKTQLKYWWQQASPEEKSSFKVWIRLNPENKP